MTNMRSTCTHYTSMISISFPSARRKHQVIRLYAGPEWSRAPVSSFARRWWDMICAGIDSDYYDSTSLQAMFFPVLLYGDFLWSCGCSNWWSLRSKIENLVQCRNESVSFEYTKRFAPNMYRSAQYLSQLVCMEFKYKTRCPYFQQCSYLILVTFSARKRGK